MKNIYLLIFLFFLCFFSNPPLYGSNSKVSVRRIQKFASKQNFSSAAAEASAYLRKKENIDILTYSAALTLILGMENSALEKYEKIRQDYQSLLPQTQKTALLLSIYYGDFDIASKLNQNLEKQAKTNSILSKINFILISSLRISKEYFFIFSLLLTAMYLIVFKVFSIRYNLGSIIALFLTIAAPWLVYNAFFTDFLLKLTLGTNPEILLYHSVFTHVTLGAMAFILFFIPIIPIKNLLIDKNRFSHCIEYIYSILLAGSFHTALISLHHFFLRGTEFNYSMLALFAGGITFSCFFAFMLYRTYKESYSYLIERTKNNLVSESCQTSSSNQPTETEIGKSIRQLIKEENFKEANKVAKTFYLLKKGAVRPEFAMRMIELLLEIDKISEAKELLGKIEKTKAIEEKKQQLSLVLAYTNILNGELAKFLKAIEEAKQGNAWLAQTDLYTIDFCYGLFHFQQHQYKEAINFLKKSLKNATTAASKMKAYFWEGMCFYELGETSEIENLISHSKNVVGLEISQSYKKLNEALLLASQKKKPEAIKTCKISLSFNEMSAPANFLICKLSVEAKEYGELQKAAFSIDKDHFLSFKALKFVV